MRLLVAMACVALCACSSSPAADSATAERRAPNTPSQAASATAPAAQPPASEAVAAPSDADQACAQIIAVSYRGVARGGERATRDQASAERLARELLAQVRGGADFAEIARTKSDAPSSAARGGIVGAFGKQDWPALHVAVRDTVFGLKVGEVASEPVLADYGYVLVRRCPVEKARSRHILVRYRGAKNANPAITRSKAEAEARARELLAKLGTGQDFAELARAESDDDSRQRGGDIGARSRGVLAVPYEQALFALSPGERSGVVESEFGFHIIERLPDPP
jgi:parvulin-like peptidyl-prolyl isomerase